MTSSREIHSGSEQQQGGLICYAELLPVINVGHRKLSKFDNILTVSECLTLGAIPPVRKPSASSRIHYPAIDWLVSI